MKIVSLGECMLEVTIQDYPKATFGFGGDTFNTAYYLSQLGVDCAFVTALGSDTQSQWLLQQWTDLGIDTQFVSQIDCKRPGIYSIHTDTDGERQFNYWRSESAAKSIFKHFDSEQWVDRFAHVQQFYFSLISIAILEPESRENLIDLISTLKKRGVQIAFDNNYRAALWENSGSALHWLKKIMPFVDIYLPSLSDEIALYQFGRSEMEQHFCTLGVDEIIIKDGGRRCTLIIRGQVDSLSFDHLKAVDTTAAGDSFNAAFLAAKSRGYSTYEAAKVGNLLAKQVIMYPGALVPRSLLNTDIIPPTSFH